MVAIELSIYGTKQNHISKTTETKRIQQITINKWQKEMEEERRNNSIFEI